jgi:hypothetical protein
MTSPRLCGGELDYQNRNPVKSSTERKGNPVPVCV